jgi:hypothetical protein
MGFSFFDGFGFQTFSSAPSSAEVVYNDIRRLQGGEEGIFRNDGYADADAACTAIQVASIYEDSLRASEQSNPDLVTVLLEQMEEQAGIAKNPSLTDTDRRALLKVRTQKVPAMNATELLAYLRIGIASGNIFSVSFPKLSGYPTTPPATSKFVTTLNPTVSFIRLEQSVGVGSNSVLVTLITGEVPQKTFVYNFIDETGTYNESVIVTDVSTVSAANKTYTITGTFTKPHHQNSGATTMSNPFWATGNRRVRVALTSAAVSNSTTMTRVRDRLERSLPSPAVYEFVQTPQDSVFTLDQDKLNLDQLLSVL